eukprot:Nk52_evm7s1945 gene=Nk52_evmTU7s1945
MQNMVTTKNAEEQGITLEMQENGVAVVRFNAPNAKVNTLGTELQAQVEDILNTIDRDGNEEKDYVTVDSEKCKSRKCIAVVIISSKPDTFIAGADVKMLNGCETAEACAALASYGQQMFNRISAQSRPVVVAIHGTALGAGLEMAMSAHYRIATNHPKTQLGLPEVKLGLFPGAGGTQRLPRLIGLTEALPMILSGSNCSASKALALGLVNELVDLGGREGTEAIGFLESHAVECARQLACGELEPRPDVKTEWSVRGILRWLTNDVWPVREFVLWQAAKSVLAKTGGHYPSPLAAIDVIRIGLEQGMEAGLQAEAAKFGEMSQTPQAKSLMGLFFIQNALKKNQFATELSEVANGADNKRQGKVGVVGVAEIGAGIAYSCLVKGMNVVMISSREDSKVGNGQRLLGVDYIKSILDKRVTRKVISVREREEILSRLEIASSYEFLKDCVVVFEATDGEELKSRLDTFREVESNVSSDCVIATTTCIHPISSFASTSARPANVVGMRYFAPVNYSMLLEFVPTEYTSLEVKRRCVEIGLEQSKSVITVKDGTGFYTTRLLGIMLVETLALIAEGVEYQRIDKCMKLFGFIVGPVTLMDELGIDTVCCILQELGKTFDRAKVEVAPLKEMCAKDLLGKRTGSGFYRTAGKESVVNKKTVEIFSHYVTNTPHLVTDKDIQMRITSRFVNEALLCLQDGVLKSPEDGDAGAVFALGFPPFLGGPFRYVDEIGAGTIANIMQDYISKVSSNQKAFKACKLLMDRSQQLSGDKFYTGTAANIN